MEIPLVKKNQIQIQYVVIEICSEHVCGMLHIVNSNDVIDSSEPVVDVIHMLFRYKCLEPIIDEGHVPQGFSRLFS